jgi:alpha-amylase
MRVSVRDSNAEVTFTDNHDTGYPQNHWPFPADRQALGYAYILTHPGIPCIFGAHFWDREHEDWGQKSLGTAIAELVAIR